MGGRATALRMPRRWIERLQIVEYARAFFTGRAGWSHFKSLLIISGAFGLFRRTAVLEAGGFKVGTVAEDMELVVRLHKHFRQQRKPYNIRFTPDPICWSEVPSDLGTLRRQRNRWHRGLWETLWTHKGMLFNPRYGRVGRQQRAHARVAQQHLRLVRVERRDHLVDHGRQRGLVERLVVGRLRLRRSGRPGPVGRSGVPEMAPVAPSSVSPSIAGVGTSGSISSETLTSASLPCA